MGWYSDMWEFDAQMRRAIRIPMLVCGGVGLLLIMILVPWGGNAERVRVPVTSSTVRADGSTLVVVTPPDSRPTKLVLAPHGSLSSGINDGQIEITRGTDANGKPLPWETMRQADHEMRLAHLLIGSMSASMLLLAALIHYVRKRRGA